jgi:hypothetical protein
VEISSLPRIRQRPSNRTFTGWLEVTGDGAVVYPPPPMGFVAPPRKKRLLVSNGLFAK